MGSWADPPRGKVLLMTGGSDSLVLWHLAGKPPAVYCTLGHRYESTEWQTLRRLQGALAELGDELRLASSPALDLADEEQPNGYVPYRNLLLATVGALHGDEVLIGAVRGDSSCDKSARFFRDSSRLLSFLEGRRVTVRAPMRGMTKGEVVAEFLRRWPEREHLLRLTRSCYWTDRLHPDVVGCGTCRACFGRWAAFSLNGIEERYGSPPWLSGAGDEGFLSDAWGNPLWTHSPVEWPGILAANAEARRALDRRALDRSAVGIVRRTDEED